MAAEGGGTDGGGRRPRAAARQCAILLVGVISALVYHADAGVYSLPRVDDSSDWTYGVRDDANWLTPGLVSAAQTDIGTPDSMSLWRRPVNAGYPRRRRRTELDPDGRFIDSSAWKRRSVLGLDNLDYAASVLDMARSRGQLRQSSLNAGAGGVSTPVDSGRDKASGDGGTLGGRQGSSGLDGSSLRRQGGASMATRLSGRRRGGQPAFGRLSMNMSPQKLRKIIDIMKAGRRRRR